MSITLLNLKRRIAIFLNKNDIQPGDQRFEKERLYYIYKPSGTDPEEKQTFYNNVDLRQNEHFFFLDKKTVDFLDDRYHSMTQEYYLRQSKCLSRYIEYYKLEAGTIPTRTNLLYTLYNTFLSSHKGMAISFDLFEEMIVLLFPSSRDTHGNLVLLNENIHVAIKLENVKSQTK